MENMVKITSHGTAYFVRKGALYGTRSFTYGDVSEGFEFRVRNSPNQFKKGYAEALKKLVVATVERKKIFEGIECF